MGATLPILVTFLFAHFRQIGRTVGLLYFANTLGSAIACFLTVDVLFAFMGQQAVVWVAAGFNLVVGALVLVDNVFSTPTFSRAVALGADVVDRWFHAATSSGSGLNWSVMRIWSWGPRPGGTRSGRSSALTAVSKWRTTICATALKSFAAQLTR